MLNDQMRSHNGSYIEEKFNQVKTADVPYALVQLNVKNFRFYMTQYGEAAGDKILCALFQRLNSFLEPEEYAAHLYADSFALLVRCEDVDVLMRCRIAAWIDILYRIDDPHIYRNIFFSLGIYPLEENQLSFQDALSRANLCRKESADLLKRNSSIEIYDQTLHDSYIERIKLEINTADAYKNYEFSAYLQPKVELSSGKIIGAEALLRWYDANGRCIPLHQFLPILNENNYIILVDLDMFDQMCRYLDQRIKKHQPVVPISFNLSQASFYDPDILQEYIRIFEQYDIPKRYVEIEFMESISLNDTARMLEVISGFQAYGFTCVLDDFGSGYSSFNVLLNAPLDIIKMDRQFFLENLNGDSKLVIQTIVKLIHSLNMKVVAEGVEQKDHVDCLRSCGCDFVQGYYYYKPMPIHAFETLLDQT